MESRRARSWTVRLSDEIGDDGGVGVLIVHGADELSLPLLAEAAAATTCWEDAMVVRETE